MAFMSLEHPYPEGDANQRVVVLLVYDQPKLDVKSAKRIKKKKNMNNMMADSF